MVILLYGPDAYRQREKLREIIAGYKKNCRNQADLRYFFEADFNFGDFQDIIRQDSIFSAKKMAVLVNVFSNRDFKEKFLKDYNIYLKSSDLIVFCQENEFSEKDKLFTTLKKTARTQNFPLLRESEMKKWLQKEAVKINLKMDYTAVNKLIDFVGNDLWRLTNEIKKLAAYRPGQQISSSDIALLVKPNIETAVFQTVDALALQNKKRAFLLINRHLAKGDSPLYLLTMINFQFKNLLMVRELIDKRQPYYLIGKQTKLHPFVLKKSYEQAGTFSLNRLKKICRQIFKAEFDIKTGRSEPSAALNRLIAEI